MSAVTLLVKASKLRLRPVAFAQVADGHFLIGSLPLLVQDAGTRDLLFRPKFVLVNQISLNAQIFKF